MELVMDFPGGMRVDAHFKGYRVSTDQPVAHGGDGSAPAPFELFLASIGTCAGFYVLSYCQQHALSTEGIRVIQKTHSNRETGLVDCIDLEIQVPESFPEKYRESLIRSANLCAVKKHLENPPSINVFTRVSQ
jgi:ribosomal protein S12 methylthiotransferase accessory factor